MQVTEHIHALKISFKIPISSERAIDRDVYSYIIFGDKIVLVDSGVTGSEKTIFDYVKKNGRFERLDHTHVRERKNDDYG